MARLTLCLVSAEMMPFAKTGGLADVVGALTRALAERGHEVRAFMPLYASVRRMLPRAELVPGLENVGLVIGTRPYSFAVRTAAMPSTGVGIYFVECRELFDRPTVYTRDPDEHRRFLLLTRAAIESCLRLGFAPDVFHCHDWHAAFLPLYLKTLYAAVPLFARSRTVLTIHNIGYQGVMSADFAPDLGIPGVERQLDAADLERDVINALKTGIRFADTVTTVSPTYAREICSAPLGMGLESALRARPRPVVGILNGVDYRAWDPRHDPYLEAHYSAEHLDGKRINKRRLLEELGLSFDPGVPLISIVSRFASQKGFDLLTESLPRVLEARPAGLAVLGSGEERYVRFFEALVRGFPGRVALRTGHDEGLAHRIEAGGDLFLMPSRYEPCGLNQMYSLRYGTIPIVRRTGGLADSVEHFDPRSGEGTGCVFEHYDVPAVEWALNTTLDWFQQPASWQRLMRNAMHKDFSWDHQIGEYERVFADTVADGPATG